MLSDTQSTIGLAKVEFGAEGCLVGYKLPMAVNLTGIFDTELEGLLVCDKDVANVHLGDGELGLRTLTLASEIQSKALLATGHVGESCARVVVGALGAECHTAGHLSVRPDFSFEGLYLGDLVLEEHLVLLDGLADAQVLAIERGYGALLAPFKLGLSLGGVIGIITIQLAVFVIIFAGIDGLLDFVALLLLFLAELKVKPLLFLLFLHLGGEGPPGELDGDGALVHNLVVLVAEERDGGGFGMDMALGEVDVVVVGFSEYGYLCLEPIIL